MSPASTSTLAFRWRLLLPLDFKDGELKKACAPLQLHRKDWHSRPEPEVLLQTRSRKNGSLPSPLRKKSGWPPGSLNRGRGGQGKLCSQKGWIENHRYLETVHDSETRTGDSEIRNQTGESEAKNG